MFVIPFLLLLSTSLLSTSPLSYLSFHSPSPSFPDPPIILLHGLLGQAKNFANLGSLLALSNPTREVYALDLRNHGGNLDAGGAWGPSMTYPILSSDVLDWMDWKGVPVATLIGHSMGGKVAMEAARTERGRGMLEGLVAIDIAPVKYEPGDGTMWEVIQKVVEACRELELGEAKTKAGANRMLKEGGVEDSNLRGFICTNLEK
ncbi:hypothetical protein TrRE_jg9736, partial [Triparma retinervis]